MAAVALVGGRHEAWNTMNMRRFPSLVGLIVGGLLALAPIFSFAGTLYTIYRVYRVMNTVGVGAAQDQSGEVGWMFLITVGSLFLCLLGVALVVASWAKFSRPDRPASPLATDLSQLR